MGSSSKYVEKDVFPTIVYNFGKGGWWLSPGPDDTFSSLSYYDLTIILECCEILNVYVMLLVTK